MLTDDPTIKRLVPPTWRPLARRAYYGTLTPAQRRARVSSHLRREAAGCEAGGSPLYAQLLRAAAEDVERQGPCWSVLRHRPLGAAQAYEGLAMRLMAGVHRVVLEGRCPLLAEHIPSAGGRRGGDPRRAFLEAVAEHHDRLVESLEQSVQTNEVGRAAALLGGFLLVARETGLPLRLREVGASAGLNLRWPEFHYRAGGREWGDPGSPVRLDSFAAGAPPFDVAVEIADRRGCDVAPLDPAREEDRLTLMSFIWADQLERFELHRGALEVARRVPVAVDAADAPDWVERELAEPAPGTATVVFHSIVMPYLPDAARIRFRRAVEAAGGRATPEAPVAWLRLEWAERGAEVRLTSWPGGTTRLVALANNLGGDVRWVVS